MVAARLRWVVACLPEKMKTIILAITLSSLCQLGADNLTSPNGQYRIVYTSGDANVELQNAKTGKVLAQTIFYGYQPEKYHEIAWSPDSRYLAVISRGTRTSSQVEVFSFIGDAAEEVTMPCPKLGNGDWPGGRSQFVKHLKWEGTTLNYYCYGDKVDGAGDPELVPENWYHFDVSMKFGGAGEKAEPKVISVTATEPRWRDEGAAAEPEKMTMDELEAYLTPPLGTGREDVESFFGFSFQKSGVNGDEDTKVIGYSLFHPVYMEVIYEEGKVAKAGIHHKVNLSDWNSELQFEVMEARHKAPEKTDEWLKQGYLHYVRGRNLLNGVQFSAWRKLPAQGGAAAP